ncbi:MULTISPECIES: DUF4160 domain-containing protein [Serratia]|uniref:DUF4160 domain-containing protein n=1 Tax=Serratia ficaria TaxID=61651 RepID=A0A240CCR2_SERFI|nr:MULTISPECIES: DUF4160 domain-containing protein [Serratia]REF43122.1 uncharacterized protein DUF4160 [Serratia ficaria]CAI1043114.1 Uncharacterised protein [Serratia ficaria]CAI1068771.1 Uncharacterised protein [Serratia ficaria]CAI1170152.1 Uncharacterised protein [Serratia ficaria]CAI1867834.1 Uncharacterised protein [Serratia ficaria]
MPVIFRYKGYKFFFYSNEGDPLEPAHIHIRDADAEAKFWLTPLVQLARNDGFNAKALKELTEIVRIHNRLFLEAWNEYFS